MSIFSSVGNFLFGGGKKGSGGYKSPYLKEYDTGTRELISSLAGASYDPETKKFDYSNAWAGRPYLGAEGLQRATEGYDFSPVDETMNAYRGTNYVPQRQSQIRPGRLFFRSGNQEMGNEQPKKRRGGLFG